jgi:tetratricopeptide (TPR) repeat protein
MSPIRTSICAIAASAALFLGACAGVEPSTNEDAKRALEQNEFRIARAHLADILTSGSADTQTYQLQLELMLATENGYAAMAAIENLPESALGGAERRAAMAHAFMLQEQPENAAALYEGLDPSDLTEQDFRMILWALMALGNDEGFAAGMDTALDAFPDSADINALAGQQLLAMDEPEAAARFAGRAIAADPVNYEALLLQGKIAIDADDLETALSYYSKAAEVYPTRAIPLANIAGLQLDLGQIEEAGKTLERGLGDHPDVPFMQWQQARYAFAIDDMQTARSARDSARRAFRSNNEFTLLSAQVEEKLGNQALAVSDYQRYLRAIGPDPEIEARIAALQER